MQIGKRSGISIILLFVILLIPGLTIAQDDGDVDEVVITTIDTAEFPVVSFGARFLNVDGRPVPDLSKSDLQVFENDKMRLS